MKTISSADIESTAFSDDFSYKRIEKMDFLLGCCITYDLKGKEIERYHSYDLTDFCIYLNTRERVYFHNLSFDFKFIKNKLLELNDYFRIVNTANSTLLVKFYKKKRTLYHKTVELRDSLALLKSSVKNLGKAINQKKIKIENNNFNDLDYCYMDCEIVGKSIFKLIKFVKDFFKIEIEMIRMPLTTASLGKKIFCNIYPNVFHFVDYKINDKMRKFYYGGRVEVFNFNLLRNACYYDVVSLYPSICVNYKMPADYCFITDDKFQISDIEKYRYNLIGFVCIINENQKIPLYPMRLDNKTVYVNGIKEVFMTIQEYDFLNKNNYLKDKIKILRINSIIQCKNIHSFNDYFIPIFKEKSTTKNSGTKYFCKILMNAITGKFGQKNDRKEITYYNYDFDVFGQDFYYDIDLDCSFTVKETKQHYQTNNLMTVICITNLARFTLWKNIVKLLKHNIESYYCDTDSIVSSEIAQKHLDFGYTLGKWNIEYKAKIFQGLDSKEYYLVKEKIKKGIKKNVLLIKFKGIRTNHFELKDISNHFEKGSITRIIPKFNYCEIRKIENESVVFMERKKNQFYVKRKINKDLTTNPIKVITNLSMLEKLNKRKIMKQVIPKTKIVHNEFLKEKNKLLS